MASFVKNAVYLANIFQCWNNQVFVSILVVQQGNGNFRSNKRTFYNFTTARWKCYFVIFNIYIFLSINLFFCLKSNENTTFLKRDSSMIYVDKILWIFKVLLKFYYLTKFCDLATFDFKISTLWIFLELFLSIFFA